jgi:hypothetical protein
MGVGKANRAISLHNPCQNGGFSMCIQHKAQSIPDPLSTAISEYADVYKHEQLMP